MAQGIMTEEKVYTVEEVAAILQVSEKTVYRMIDSGELKSFRVRRRIRIRQSALDAVKQGQSEPKGEGE